MNDRKKKILKKKAPKPHLLISEDTGSLGILSLHVILFLELSYFTRSKRILNQHFQILFIPFLKISHQWIICIYSIKTTTAPVTVEKNPLRFAKNTSQRRPSGQFPFWSSWPLFHFSYQLDTQDAQRIPFSAARTVPWEPCRVGRGGDLPVCAGRPRQGTVPRAVTQLWRPPAAGALPPSGSPPVMRGQGRAEWTQRINSSEPLFT